MNVSHWLFEPKYPRDVLEKVLGCFCSEFLNYGDMGVTWDIRPIETNPGWWEFTADLGDFGSGEYPSETVFTEQVITGEQLTASMMVILVEYELANYHADIAQPMYAEPGSYCLTDIELGGVIAALSETGSTIYSPYGRKLFTMVTGKSWEKCTAVQNIDMTDWMLSQ
jgi:hypothetical protein